MAVAVVTPQLREAPQGWVSSPRWDLFWMFSALWASALCGVLGLAIGPVRLGALVFAASGLLAVVHSFSTTWMVLGSPLLRDARHRNPRKYVALPLAIGLGSLGLGLAIGFSDGFPRRYPLDAGQALWVLYLTLFWVGHFWHFGNQDFGVLSIYRSRSGQDGRLERRVDKVFAVAMMFFIQPLVYLKSVSGSPWSEAVFSFVPVSPEFVRSSATVGVGVAVVLTAAVVMYELSKPRVSTPKLLYYGVMLSHPLVLYFLHWELGVFYLIAYFWSHWLVAIGLVGRINTGYYRGRGASRRGALLWHLRTVGVLAGLGAVFHFFFGEYSLFSGGNYKELLSAVWPEWQWVIGLILGVFLAEQLLHYYCDRCLFRFRDPDVRRAVSPLV